MVLIDRKMKSFKPWCLNNLQLLEMTVGPEVGGSLSQLSVSCSEIPEEDFCWRENPGKFCRGVDLYFSLSVHKCWCFYWNADNQNTC